MEKQVVLSLLIYRHDHLILTLKNNKNQIININWEKILRYQQVAFWIIIVTTSCDFSF